MEISRWHGRNYPQRGESKDILVKDMALDPETLVYIGKKDGSGFDWIGKYSDVPEEYSGKRVLEQYKRTYGYIGEILLVDDEKLRNGKKKGGSGGKYWNWNECDKSVPPYRNDQITVEGAELLLMAIARDEAHDYRNKLRHALKDKHDSDAVKKIIRNVRKVHGDRLSFLSNTSQGDHIIQRTEDEAFVIATQPEIQNVPYEKRYEIINKGVAKLMRERVKAKEDGLYAHIKGRSVKH